MNPLIVDWPERRELDRDGENFRGGGDKAIPLVVAKEIPVRKRKSVRFAGTVDMYCIERTEDMSDEEVQAVWYSNEECKTIKKQVKASVQYMTLLHKKGDQATEREVKLGKKFCLRGLEHLASPETLHQRSTQKDAVIKSVLKEQERQELARAQGFGGGGLHNLNMASLALASSTASKFARDMAAIIGAKDYSAVAQLCRNQQLLTAPPAAMETRRVTINEHAGRDSSSVWSTREEEGFCRMLRSVAALDQNSAEPSLDKKVDVSSTSEDPIISQVSVIC